MTTRRKHIPLLAQLHAALYQLGLEPQECDLDHSPPLAMREWSDEANDTVPPASDPKYLVWRTRAAHKEKTFGQGGEKRITTAGSDIHAIAHVKRLNGEKPKKKQFRPWPKRRMR